MIHSGLRLSHAQQRGPCRPHLPSAATVLLPSCRGAVRGSKAAVPACVNSGKTRRSLHIAKFQGQAAQAPTQQYEHLPYDCTEVGAGLQQWAACMCCLVLSKTMKRMQVPCDTSPFLPLGVLPCSC
jgi:hypothetical protein